MFAYLFLYSVAVTVSSPYSGHSVSSVTGTRTASRTTTGTVSGSTPGTSTGTSYTSTGTSTSSGRSGKKGCLNKYKGYNDILLIMSN